MSQFLFSYTDAASANRDIF